MWTYLSLLLRPYYGAFALRLHWRIIFCVPLFSVGEFVSTLCSCSLYFRTAVYLFGILATTLMTFLNCCTIPWKPAYLNSLLQPCRGIYVTSFILISTYSSVLIVLFFCLLKVFLIIRRSLKRCSALTKSQTLLNLFKVCFRTYA